MSSPVPQSILRKAMTYGPSPIFEMGSEESPYKRRQPSFLTNELSSDLSLPLQRPTISIND